MVLELDFETVILIECKFKNRLDQQDLRGIRKFKSLYDQVKLSVVMTPEERCYWIEDGVLHLPWAAI